MTIARAVNGVFIVAAKRTAFGTYGGKLAGCSATELAVLASKGALASCSIKPELIQSVTFGNVIQSSSDAAYLARHVGLKCGVAVETPALTVNRLCGSGFQAVVNGAQEIELGECDLVLVGGTENMSQAPYAVRNIRFGTRLGQDLKLEDTLWAGLTDNYVGLPMGITAENLAQKYNISRRDCDEFAFKTQTKWNEANENGCFKSEIVPVTIKGKKGDEQFEIDEHPRVTSFEKLSKLPSVFKKDGTVTAGNASGVCDGASALILASEAGIKKNNLTPIARLVSYGISGCDPSIMGMGPASSSRAALKTAGLDLNQMDLVEVNEAFAPQFLAVAKELGLNLDITNTCGGAIALGHPLGASGARIVCHLTHQLRKRSERYGLGTACIGGGQGIAIIVEKP